MLRFNIESSNQIESELARLSAVRAEVEKVRLDIQRELELAKHLRAEAERYQRQTATKSSANACSPDSHDDKERN